MRVSLQLCKKEKEILKGKACAMNNEVRHWQQMASDFEEENKKLQN